MLPYSSPILSINLYSSPPRYVDSGTVASILIHSALISNLITMTPGSLTLDLSPDRRTLVLHILYLDDRAELIRHLQKNYVQRVRQLF